MVQGQRGSRSRVKQRQRNKGMVQYWNEGEEKVQFGQELQEQRRKSQVYSGRDAYGKDRINQQGRLKRMSLGLGKALDSSDVEN